jgi:protein SCO1/2
MSRREAWPLAALAAILAISAAWWALALWPLPADTPDWLQRARFVCFGSLRDTLPSAAGWTLLIGEPLAMLGALAVIWRDGLLAGLAALWRSRPGRWGLVTVVALVAVGLSAAAGRVYAGTRGVAFDPTQPTAEAIPRLDRPAPPLGLVDQHGDTLSLARFRGRPLLVAFAYAHCVTICPVIVHDAIEAQGRLTAPRPALIVVTLDPWRDTPSRLPAIAEAWQLGADAFAASGSVAQVERMLDAWQVPRARDASSGDVTHGALVYVVDAAGRIQFAAPTGAQLIAELVERL